MLDSLSQIFLPTKKKIVWLILKESKYDSKCEYFFHLLVPGFIVFVILEIITVQLFSTWLRYFYE